MSLSSSAAPEVFTMHDVARAADVSIGAVRALAGSSGIVTVGQRYIGTEDAIGLVRSLRATADAVRRDGLLFMSPVQRARPRRAPFAASATLHAALLGTLVLVATLGARTERTEPSPIEPARLVFLATPGPGGGGGGGGLRQPAPPPKAETRGRSKLRSPVTLTRKVARAEPPKPIVTPPPVVPEPRPDPLPPPPAPPTATPPVVAPVVSAPADTKDQTGTIANAPATAPSNGPGTGSGTGNGSGAGIGEGTGAGIGKGSGAGTGGGPYRPGSGVAPPSLLREVKPLYTEEGRRRGIEGDVVMEVVVRADGSVGAVRILQGLGSGLDQRAAEAVRQWRFSPARRFGSPVDVLVEVAVEFRLR